ncbi:PD-(D/E)XK nuclease family protein [Azoarcus sp. KH32C]|uniref:PD-(D/E)XK nuclease family protein n=1 Tax=Azoarcus sp. KH32C TaxID=748247 RepID=UPI0018D4B9EE|nr:PD-(D/E)XK nuclease family protein [Azoarcus sp. KH32C]
MTSYLGHLRLCDNHERFYSRSLEADSVGTAAELLSWRDEWRLAGWDGSAPDDAPQRLRELALVEQSAASNFSVGEAERLVAVIAALSTEPIPIKSVLLVDPIASFPWVWRKTLALLPNVSQWMPEPQGQGQLRQLQECAQVALRNGRLQPIGAPISDGSVVILQASTREVAKHWLSAMCQKTPADRLLVCEAGGDAVDTTMTATGGSGSGFQNPSELRPSLQAVGLALEMCWSPIDVGRLVEFLAHPIGPFSRKARFNLARAVAEQPGIGGASWNAVKEKIGATEDGKGVLESIAFWLEGDRWSRDEGAPVDALLVRVDKLATALRKRLTGDESARASLVPAVEQCLAVLEGLTEFKRQGIASLTPRHVEQLIVHATPGGTTNPGSPAQVGCIRAESSAAACIEPADEVIWWMPSTPLLPTSLPWSQAEVTALGELGVHLRDPQQELEALSNQWLHPLLVAKQRFVLVLPPAGAEEHPFRQLLCKLAPALTNSCIDIDAELEGAFVGTLSTNLARMELPQTPRFIELNAPLELPSWSQSYSSLSELFNDPALYALKRVALLRPATVLAAEEDNRLLGTLAHRVFEKFFGHSDALAWTNGQALEWFRGSVDELLQTEGALLLMRGAGVSQQRFKAVCERAICSMLDHLRAAGALRVRTEVCVDGELGNVPLNGQVDLIVEFPGSLTVALDMKWRGDKHYQEILRQGNHLQLALYSLLIEQKTGAAPVALGYFMVESGSMYVTASGAMPKAQVRTPPAGATASLLQQAKETWRWRAQQWATGQIEVVPIGAGDDYQGPLGTLHVEGPRTWDKDHLVLLGGWGQ